jgi:glucuronoarabinoxylan endo-1,4-beta-xylanase
MKQSNHNLMVQLELILVLFLFFSTILSESLYGQTISISGKITSSRLPVRNASITFIDNANTTRKFSALTDESGNYRIGIITSVESVNNTQPSKFELEQNYPNPFFSSTALPYGIKETSHVRVTIYDILGKVVRKFDVGQQSVGLYNVLWDGQYNSGLKVANGIYFYRLEADGESRVRKMIFNKDSKEFVSLPRSFSSTKSLLKTNLAENSQTTVYTARIENTSTTSPLVVSKEIPNIVIKNDTTINFNVDCLPVATINFDILHQIIRGFGASNVLLWRPDMTSSEVETAFGTGDGQIGFSILRIMIESDSSRWGLYLSSVKKAQSMGATIIASPWFAPSDMVETVDGRIRIRYDKYGKYAAHLNSFITFMKNNGVSIYGISIQNEPDMNGTWTSFTPGEMLTFMKENADAIEGTYVMAPESFQFKRSMSDPILNDSVACANTDIICGHIYGAGLSSYPLAKSKGKEVWMTEYLFGEQNSANNWSWAFKVATNMNNVMEADMSAYIWWNIIRYYGPIGDGEKAAQNPNESYPNKGEVTKKGYVMSQFSKFIRPGYYRIESSVYPPLTVTGVDVTAYKDSITSKVVIVAVNSFSTQVETVFRIQNGIMTTTIIPYITSESKNCEQQSDISYKNGSFTYTLDPLSITTFVSN